MKESLRRFLRNVRKHPGHPGWLQVRTRSDRRKGIWRTCPPLHYRWEIIRMYHDMLGHAGTNHTFQCLFNDIYWPAMRKDVRAFCAACIVCQQRKAVVYQPASQTKTEIHGPLKHIHVDLAGPFKAEKGNPLVSEKVQKTVTFEALQAIAALSGRKTRGRPPAQESDTKRTTSKSPIRKGKPAANKASTSGDLTPDSDERSPKHWILIIVDYFTKAAEFVPIPDKSSEIVAHSVYDHWFCRYGTPKHVTSDNGTEFQGAFAGMLQRLGVNHIHTAVRHPQSNGACERLVGTIKRKLYSYCDGHSMHWMSYLPRLRYAYMQEVHSSTRIAPFELLYGFVPRHPLPVHIGHINMQSPYVNDASYMDLVMARELVDADLCKHVEDLRDKCMTFDAQVFDSINEMQDRQIERFYQRKEKANRALPVFDVGDDVFEIEGVSKAPCKQ